MKTSNIFPKEKMASASTASSSSASVPKKRSWKDDAAEWVTDARTDPAVAAAWDAAAAEKARAAAEKALYAAEAKKHMDDWHAWKKATPYVWEEYIKTPGILGNCEKGWEVAPVFGQRKVPNRTICPYCGKSCTA
jgi:hypothetical protein